MTPNMIIMELQGRLSDLQLNSQCSMSVGEGADNLTFIVENKTKNPKQDMHIEGWHGLSRAAAYHAE